MYSDNKLIIQILGLLKKFNIDKVVISPGSRHYPLTKSLEADEYFELYSIVDERSAAFFAIGLIQQTNRPVAICCTSGSAMINYGSAVSEAYYQHLPLLLITADRMPELLNQKEDQMIPQDNLFHEFIKYHGQLRDIKSKTDEWYVNRIINEALIELDHHGQGPVQINYPILKHSSDTFHTHELPILRKITCHEADIDKNKWLGFAKQLIGKKVMIIWGQSVLLTQKIKQSLDKFCHTFNCVILTDRISNCHHSHAIDNAFVVLRSMTWEEQKELAPDIVITIGGNIVFNGEIKRYLKVITSDLENWQIGREGSVCDPFHCLTEIFEMNEHTFFENIADTQLVSSLPNEYYSRWSEISNRIEEPNVGYSQLYAIGKLIKALPKNVILHLANSNTIRMGHLFRFDKSISCYCNRGVNGVDGCMSTAVGCACSTDQLVFLVIGDLSFFYDMNALWNRHLSNKLRILLVNNEGGAVMHLPFNREVGKTLSRHTSAGHCTSAKGWIESLGIRYIKANCKKDVDEGVSILADEDIDGPVLLEVFTKKEDDVLVLKQYFSHISRMTLAGRARRKAGRIVSKYLSGK